MKKVFIREVSTRDGFQFLNKFIPTKIKLDIASKILKSGVFEIEATSFVNKKVIYQLKDSSEFIKELKKKKKKVIFSALTPNVEGVINAVEANVDKIIYIISSSEAHNKANLNKSIKDSMNELKKTFKIARSSNIPIVGSISVAFGCPYEGKIKKKNILKIIEAFLSMGAKSVILADTIGVATPVLIEKTINLLDKEFLNKKLIMHFHNNYGFAIANLLSSIYSGIYSFDTSLGGLGGCPYIPSVSGNIPTEDVVFTLSKMNMCTGIDAEKICEASIFLKKNVGCKISSCVIKNKKY